MEANTYNKYKIKIPKTINELEQLQQELGADYLDKVKAKIGKLGW